MGDQTDPGPLVEAARLRRRLSGHRGRQTRRGHSRSHQKVRFQATAYIGTLVQQGNKKVGAAVAKAYEFDADAKNAPWHGGPLYVPGIQWQKEDATALVGNLIAWHLWCDRNGKTSEQQQIYNNLRSVGLSRVAGSP